MPDFLKALEEWARFKLSLWKKESSILFKDGEIWWCSIGVNLGEESYGKGKKFRRPVLVLRKLTHNAFIGLPLTTVEKTGTWYVNVHLPDGKGRWAMMNQIRMLDKRRLTKRLGAVDWQQLKRIRGQFVTFLVS